MSLITLIVVLVVVGMVMYLVNNYVPMDAGVKKILNVAVIILIVLWLLSVLFGVNVAGIRVG